MNTAIVTAEKPSFRSVLLGVTDAAGGREARD